MNDTYGQSRNHYGSSMSRSLAAAIHHVVNNVLSEIRGFALSTGLQCQSIISDVVIYRSIYSECDCLKTPYSDVMLHAVMFFTFEPLRLRFLVLLSIGHPTAEPAKKRTRIPECTQQVMTPIWQLQKEDVLNTVDVINPALP